MTYLDPQAGGGGYVNVGLEDLTGVNTIDYNDWPDGVYKFRIDYWDVNMNGNSQDPTLALRNSTGLPQFTGYNNICVEEEQAAFNRIITTNTTRIRMDGASGLGLYHGFFEGYLVDPAAFTWLVQGQFYDDFDDSFMKMFCEVTIGARLFGMRIQTANVGSMTAGFLSAKYWTA